jgi:hypothetical protein
MSDETKEVIEEEKGTQEEDSEDTAETEVEAEPEQPAGSGEYEAISIEEERRLPPWRRVLDWSKAAKGWAAVISILGATGLAFYGAALKKDPVAVQARSEVEETWKVAQAQLNTLAKEVNRLARANRGLKQTVQKLSLRVVFLQAHEAGFNQGSLHEQIAQLQEENARLRTRAVGGGGDIAIKSAGGCRAGSIEVGGRCRRVGKEVAQEILGAKAEAETARRKAKAEEKLRKEAEAAGLSQAAATAQQGASKIPLLPKRLDDAAKLLKKVAE